MILIYSTIVVFGTIAIFMRKKVTLTEFYGSVYFGVFWAMFSDLLVDKYDLYYFFKPKVFDLHTLWILLAIYPFAAMMIINWFPFHKSLLKMISYIVAWSIFSTFYEWLSLRSGILIYIHWKLWYSAVLYPFLYSGLILNHNFIRWIKKKGPVSHLQSPK
jgi:hypothetical protein